MAFQELEGSQPPLQADLEEARLAVYESWAARFPQKVAAFDQAAQLQYFLSHSLSPSLWKRQAYPPVPHHTGSTFYALASNAARNIVNTYCPGTSSRLPPLSR